MVPFETYCMRPVCQFLKSGKGEISKNYTQNESTDFTITPELVLQNTIDTCLILAKHGAGTKDEKQKFAELQKGIKALGGFLMSGSFRIEDAISASARIAYLAAKLLQKAKDKRK